MDFVHYPGKQSGSPPLHTGVVLSHQHFAQGHELFGARQVAGVPQSMQQYGFTIRPSEPVNRTLEHFITPIPRGLSAHHLEAQAASFLKLDAAPRSQEIIVISDDEESEQLPNPPSLTSSRNAKFCDDVGVGGARNHYAGAKQLRPTPPPTEPPSCLKERKKYLAQLARGETPYYRWWASFNAAKRKDQEKYCRTYWPTNEEAWTDVQYVSGHWIDFTQTRFTRLQWSRKEEIMEEKEWEEEDWTLFMDEEHRRLRKELTGKVAELNGSDKENSKKGKEEYMKTKQEAKKKRHGISKRNRVEEEEDTVEQRKRQCTRTPPRPVVTHSMEEDEDEFTAAVTQELAKAGCTGNDDQATQAVVEEELSENEFDDALLRGLEDAGCTE